MACRDVIEYILRHREIEDLNKRLTAIDMDTNAKKRGKNISAGGLFHGQ
jgi:hypothetical protein